MFGRGRPATIIKAGCGGEGRNTSPPNRAPSNRAAAIDIISIAQHASPNPSGQIELLRAQFTALSSVVKMIPSSSSNLPKSSGLVSVTCLPNDVLISPRHRSFSHTPITCTILVAQPILAVRLDLNPLASDICISTYNSVHVHTYFHPPPVPPPTHP